MKSFTKIDVSEAQLEELVRRHCGTIEEGLTYLDHQMQTAGGRLDVLFVDRNKALVVAELKVVQDDGMLVQCLDYYDYATMHVETITRLYKDHSIDPAKKVRLFLIAPEFSPTLINRCKWLDLQVSLYSFTCLRFENEKDIYPVFAERTIPNVPETIEVSRIEDHLDYITDGTVRAKVGSLLDEIKEWKPGCILLDPKKYSISMKASNRVFAYLSPRQRHFIIETYSDENQWKAYPIKTDDDLANVKAIMRAAMERRV
jgi:hypothetical protein